MRQLTSRRRRRDEDGFTLVELVVTVAILGIIVSALAGVVLAYLRTTVDSQARMTESHDVQFVSAYWQRDVASIGVRSTTYDHSDGVHSYPLLQSVDVVPGCSLPAGDPVATLAWTQYTTADPDHPTTVTVSYLVTKPGSRWVLTRVRCTGLTVDSTVKLADNLTVKPVLACPGAASGCTGTGPDVPTVVTLTLTASDPADPTGPDYTATLSGERRQS
jgi:prepilin-type N-terminal cleavage/methylation domain-containing protein